MRLRRRIRPNAFGNALGESLAYSSSSAGVQPSPNAGVNELVDAVNGFSAQGIDRYPGVNVVDGGGGHNDMFPNENLSRMSELAARRAGGWIDAEGRFHIEITGIGSDVPDIARESFRRSEIEASGAIGRDDLVPSEARTFQEINEQKVLGGTYDRYEEIRDAVRQRNWGNFWGHVTFEGSDAARAAVNQRLNPPPTHAQLKFQTSIGLAVGGPLTGWAGGARLLGAPDKIVNELAVAQMGLLGSIGPAVAGQGSVVAKVTQGPSIGLRGVASPSDLDGAMATRVNRYADLVKSNQPWTWSEVDTGLSQLDRQLIRKYAEHAQIVPSVPVDPVTRFADFSRVAIRQEPLPQSHWSKSDREQFSYLDAVIGGRPLGTTWHHDVLPGNMQLVPFGVHNITSHAGGRTTWSQGKR